MTKRQKMKMIGTKLLVVAVFGLAACSNTYYERKDTVTFGHGDAVQSNIAIQTPDPWPKRSQDTKIPMDPIKAAQAMYRYRCGGNEGVVGFQKFGGTAGTDVGAPATPAATGGYCQ